MFFNQSGVSSQIFCIQIVVLHFEVLAAPAFNILQHSPCIVSTSKALTREPMSICFGMGEDCLNIVHSIVWKKVVIDLH